jgi:hypothetical protein
MEQFGLWVRVISMTAWIAGGLGAFICGLGAQYTDAIIFLVMFVLASLCLMLSNSEIE